MVKNLSAIRETRVRSLGWEDPLEKGKATHCSILAWGIPWAVSETDERPVSLGSGDYSHPYFIEETENS